ncbi:MAG: lamin tail domain-containing protein [Kiritimatiellae bacterium]|nr:lamin tail domain-containing protein [Kiritimatiellia bacterium]
MAGAEAFTIMAWVRRESIGSGQNTSARIVSDTSSLSLNGSTAGFEFRFSGAQGALNLRINGNEVGTSVGGVPPDSDAWHHVAVVYDGTRPATNTLSRNVHFYVDGIQRGDGNTLTNVLVAGNTNPLTVGNSSVSRGVGNLMVGKIDDVLILSDYAPEAVGNGKTNEAIRCYMLQSDDLEPPMIEAPTDVTVDVDSGECYASHINFGEAITTDDCGLALVTNNAPTMFPVGVTFVVWSAMDYAGNESIATQRVTVVDNIPPYIECPPDLTIYWDDCPTSITNVNFGEPVVSDNCQVVGVVADIPAIFQPGVTTVVWQVWDASGNTNTCEQLVTLLPSESADCDGDGLPDIWEMQHGLDPFSAEDATEDSDMDGWSNLEEYLAGTDPFDRLSAPRIARGVVINEVLYNPAGEDLGYEWIELYCAGPREVDLSEFKLEGTLSAASSVFSNFFTFPQGARIQPGYHLLIGGTEMDIRRDYTQNFELVNNDRGKRTGGVRLVTPTNGMVVDALLYDYPNSYNLATNGFGPVGPNDRPRYARSRESLMRVMRGYDSDRVTDWVATSNSTPHGSEVWVDSDGDGIGDGDELTGALHPEGIPTNYLNPDSDGDGLNDWYELYIGTDPWNPDTDGDGVLDGVEALEAGSNPLVVDFDGTSFEVWSAAGAAFASAEGVWGTQGASAYALNKGGILVYTMNLAADGVYALEVQGTQYDADSIADTFLLQLSINEQTIGSKELRASYGSSGKTMWMLPWLPAGQHTLTLRWRYRADNGSLRIIRLQALTLGGPDTDANGKPDWLDHRAQAMIGINEWPTSSLVSPVCLEGWTLCLDAMDISSSYIPSNGVHALPRVRSGLGMGWFADIPLSIETSTVVTVVGDNGWVSQTGTLTWVELNLLNPPTNQYRIRRNDGFLFNLRPANGATGSVSITVNGAPVYFSTSNQPWACYFTNSGQYEISGQWTLGNSTQYGETVTVAVVAASFPSEPAVWSGYYRDWDCPDIPTNIWVGMEGGVTWQRSAGSPTGSAFQLFVAQPNAYTALARLDGTNGPVLASTRVLGFTQLSNADYGQTTYFYDDGSRLVVMGVLLDGEIIPPDIEVHIAVVASGVVVAEFDHYGSSTHAILVPGAHMNEWGLMQLAFYVEADAWSVYCHSLYVMQGDAKLGDR